MDSKGRSRSEYGKSSSRSSSERSRIDSYKASKKGESYVPENRDPRIQATGQWSEQQQQTNNTGQMSANLTSYQHLNSSGTMYGNAQYGQGYSSTYSTYPGYTGYNVYDTYGQTQSNYTVPGAVQPGPPGEEYPQSNWAPVGNSYGISVNHQDVISTTIEKIDTKMEGVVEEMKKQNAELVKQREEYERRVLVLRRELDLLRKQKQELLSEGGSERDTELILKENGKLQVEINNKLKDAYNVIEILSGIIGDSSKVLKEDDAAKEPPPPKHHRSNTPEKTLPVPDGKYNYIHYDPELHWCRVCDVFPKTAKDLLMHLHSPEHREAVQDDNVKVPWHNLPKEPEFPHYEGAPKKRLPIKGLQFFMSATAWYCRLCDQWIGDLHCASLHLKSLNHSQNYTNFVEQNPHWEIEWLKDRERALDRVNRRKDSDSDGRSKRKHKDKRSPGGSNSKDKRKKKKSKKRRKHSSDSSSSSSSSDSSSDDDKEDKSKSIRVAMRNKFKAQLGEEEQQKWEVFERLVEERKRKEHLAPPPPVIRPASPPKLTVPEPSVRESSVQEDRLINQWMTVKEPESKDKYLLDSLKDRLKVKQEQEKIRLAEMEQKRKEKEKAEQEAREREEREMREREEKKRKEEEEMHKLKERDREQVRFKQRGQYRKRSQSKSPRRSRSRSNDRYDHRKERSSENGSSRRHYESPDRSKKSRDSRDEDKKDRKPPPPPSYKKLPFIGRMPLFKNKKIEEKTEKEIKKEEYDIPRQSRFQPGNLARAFIPDPEVVCFPKLSSYPPISIPPPTPEAPKITAEPAPPAPPPPKLKEAPKKEEPKVEVKPKPVKPPIPVYEPPKQFQKKQEPVQPQQQQMPSYEESMNMMYSDPNMMTQYSYDYNMIYPHPTYDYSQDVPMDTGVPMPPAQEEPELKAAIPLPPLPPEDDDLAMLGMSSDDLAAQCF